jgi:hypothetical protein
MKYLILTMLLTVGQASSPVPRQTPDSATNASNGNQKDTNSPNGPTNQTPASIDKQAQTTNHNEPTEKQNEADIQHSVVVREFPPVTINSRRDWADWGAWFFTFLLAVTSALQVWLLCRTLIFARRQTHEIKRQRSYMRLQWVQMIEAGKQTERVITQSKENEVRDLRAYVGVSKVLLMVQNIAKPRGVVEFQNFGKTPARNVRQWIGIAINSHPLTITLPESPDPTMASTTIIYPGIKNVLFVDLKKELPQGTEIGTSELTVYVYGRVTYYDIFGNNQELNYRFIFGGPQGGQTYRDERNVLFGAMYADSEGNNAT